MKRADFLWINIDMVIPNSKNPRKDPGVKTEEIQSIIRSKGWEEGITVYKKGVFYIILSGHRRWYAAKKMGIKELPLYIVDAPKNDMEEIERLGSVQSGQVDWSPYEWAEYTVNMYEKMGFPSYTTLASKFGVSHSTIATRIRVHNYYPKSEIELKLENGMYGMKSLEAIRVWIQRAKEFHKDLVQSLGEDTLRQMLLRKYENKCFGTDIQNDQFVVQSNDKQLLTFLTDPNATLKESMKQLEQKDSDIRVTNMKHNARKIQLANKDIDIISYRTKKEAREILKSLTTLEEEIQKKKEYLREKMAH